MTPDSPGRPNPIDEESSGTPTFSDGTIDAGIGERFPVWSLGDVARVAFFFFLAAIFFGVLALLIAAGLPVFKAVTPARIATDPRLIVPAQLAAYIVTFWFVYRMIARHYGVPFAEGIRWNWPRVVWPAYLVLGIVLAFAITGLQNVIPMPSKVPFDKFLTDAGGIWLLAIFGSLLAPFAEEIFFRGLMFPSVARSLSVGTSVIATAFCFALLHGAQLGWHWGPVLLLFVVGVVLTLVRAWARSVAASVLVHVSYNVTLFVFMYVATDGFRNLEKLMR